MLELSKSKSIENTGSAWKGVYYTCVSPVTGAKHHLEFLLEDKKNFSFFEKKQEVCVRAHKRLLVWNGMTLSVREFESER